MNLEQNTNSKSVSFLKCI